MINHGSYRFLAFFTILTIWLSACGGRDNSNNKLIGKWEYKEPFSGSIVTLEFTKDKMRYSAVGLEAGPVASYTYVDEDTILVRNAGSKVDLETPYSIQGDTLKITFSGEGNVVFTRVK